jgi:FkbM family methyltransferase
MAHKTLDKLRDGFARWYLQRVERRGGRMDGQLDRWLQRAARLYARTQLLGHVALTEALLVGRPQYWPREDIRRCRGCWHGYRLQLDLRDYFQRQAYFLGRYHELPVQVLMRAALRRGDVFVDVGANNGLLALMGAWLVGPGGRVLAFEPNPVAARQLRWHVRVNRLKWVELHTVGLSNTEAELELAVPGVDNLGAGTFAAIPARYGEVVQVRCRARTVRGDDVLRTCRGAMFIKLDVEGFEHKALLGLRGTLERLRPLVVMEVNPEMLAMAGTSAPALHALMDELGYAAYSAEAQRVMGRRSRLALRPFAGPPQGEPLWDVVWLHPEGEHTVRLARFMQSSVSGA